MIHTITTTHQVEAESWDLAVAEYLKQPLNHMTACQVQAPGAEPLHIAMSNLAEAYEKLKGQA